MGWGTVIGGGLGAVVGGPVGAVIGGSIGTALEGDQQRGEIEAANNRQIRMAEQNIELQREFAKNGLRWKVEDAKAAGIHPLAAVGAPTASFSPVGVGDTGIQQNMQQNFGQDLSRAMSATLTEDERVLRKIQISSAKADLDGKLLDNTIRTEQLMREMQTGPAFPGSKNLIEGQPDATRVKDIPLQRVVSAPGRAGVDPGAVNYSGYGQTVDGTLVPIPAKDLKERIEDNIFHEAVQFVRDNFMPNLTGGNPPPGYEWDYPSQGYRKKGHNKALKHIRGF